MSNQECDQLRNETLPAGYHIPASERPVGASMQYGIFIFENLCYIVFFFAFLFFKHLHPSRGKFARLQQRPSIYVFLTHLGASFSSVNSSWYAFRDLDKGVPCWLYIMDYYLAVACLAFPLAVRLLRFYRDNEWTSTVVLLADTENNSPQQRGSTSIESSRNATSGSIVQWTKSGIKSFSGKIRSLTSSWKSMLETLCCHRISSENIHINPALSVGAGDEQASDNGDRSTGKVNMVEPAKNIMERLHAMKFLKSTFGSRVTLILVFTPYILTTIISLATHPMVISGCWGCGVNEAQEIVGVIETILSLSMLVVCYRINRSKKDPFGIVQEVRLAIWLAGFPAVICSILHAALHNTTLLGNDFSFIMLTELFLVIYCFVQSLLQCILAMVDLARERSAMAKTTFSLKEFENEFLRKTGKYHDAFAKHLAAEHGYESMAFLLDVFQWEKQYFDVNPKTARARSKKIINLYVGETAELPCNLSENCVKSIRRTIENSDEDLKFDFFNVAKWEIIKMLHKDSFRRFVSGKEYRRLAAATAGLSPAVVIPSV
jgi:hypothetical protein